MDISEAMQAHLDVGVTHLCRCWGLERRDGLRLGFTDHDRDLQFESWTFKADTGLTAAALQQATGLSVDNSEALGALSAAAVQEKDILAGRFDGADVSCWLVNWSEVAQRRLLFRGQLGELHRADGAFRAELRGLSDLLNSPLGRVFQKPCGAVLGDVRCGVALDSPGYRGEGTIKEIETASRLRLEPMPGFADGWFTRGVLEVMEGAATGLKLLIKQDTADLKHRQIQLWSAPAVPLSADQRVRLTAGCDKRPETCRLKFDNILNFQGFPHIPGDDWMLAAPQASAGEHT